MPSPTTARGPLGHFPRGADLPATDQRASLPPIQLLKYLSLWAISAAGARGGGERSRAEWADTGSRGMSEVGVAEQGGKTGMMEGIRAARWGGKEEEGG